MSAIAIIKGINLNFKDYKYLTQYKSATMLQLIITYTIKDSDHFQLVHARTHSGKFVRYLTHTSTWYDPALSPKPSMRGLESMFLEK
jgi:hypothetical protein